MARAVLPAPCLLPGTVSSANPVLTWARAGVQMYQLMSRTTREVPEQGGPGEEQCMVYQALCIDGEATGIILSAVGVGLGVAGIVLGLVKRAATTVIVVVIKVINPDSEDNGDCLRADGSYTVWWGCTSSGGIGLAEEWQWSYLSRDENEGVMYSQWYLTNDDTAYGLTLTSLNAGADLVLSNDFVGGPPWFYWTFETENGAALPALSAAAAHAALPAPVMTS
jgi:hypothetical protein